MSFVTVGGVKVFGAGTKLIVSEQNEDPHRVTGVERLEPPPVSLHIRVVLVTCFVTVGAGKVFGAGTKLVVSDTPAERPQVSVFRASNDRVACVAYGFFPDVIKFEWKKKVRDTTEALNTNEKDEQLDLPITKIEDGSDKYSATSLLIYKGGNPSYKFVCVVNHEGFTKPEEFTEVIPESPASSSGHVKHVTEAGDLETDDCRAQYAEGLDFQPFNVATLSYTLFILKSVVYCAVVVFLTYQSKSV
ncbi:uncharacterized protein LOC127528345 [Erpetoichthys calabaricus]|uniref:uncharacterized protein LOC127528345 n=1 Tax=Erpetoichthys calabaricus TaxID=27687 RepID=UPI002234245F|nr:uncharacterized protein LOC127528345 [Erpetoichthys calabaricus]